MVTVTLQDGRKKKLDWSDSEARAAFWHTTAHILAQAVLELFPDAKRTIGPPIEEGFYYDFEREKPFTEEDLKKIEKRMQELAAKDAELYREDMSIADAKKFFRDNPYKRELIEEFAPSGKGTLSFYCHDTYKDLCKGGHLDRTGAIKAMKLLKVAGSYWRGDAKNKQLQRIYGISFPDRKMLDEYLKKVQEAEQRDHRKIGKELELFMFHELSPGSAFYFPKGATIYHELLQFLRMEYRKHGYQEVVTPLLYHKQLWETSGHWQHFQENMFILNVDEQEFALKPMNCPSHCMIYSHRTRSYRDLPLRIADFAPLHRNELRGVLGGLTRVRKFVQDDAHLFITSEQMEQELLDLLDFAKYIYQEIFDFQYHVVLSTKPEKAIGDAKLWEKAEKALAAALQKKKIAFAMKPGEGAFYGPKIDFHIQDALGRSWQLATIQLDFNLPERFDLTYEGQDGKKHRPIMIHRAILGSLERFIAVLTEHYAGKFPLWLSPVQVIILTIADRHASYAEKIRKQFFDAGVRVEVDSRGESIPKKVREAQLQKIPYILVVGDREEKDETVTVRTRDNIVHGEKKVAAFIEQIKGEIVRKA